MALGDELVKRGSITREQLEKALAAQAAGDGRRIGEIVVSMGFATEEQVKAALAS